MLWKPVHSGLRVGLHALKMNKNTVSSGISLSVKRLRKQTYHFAGLLEIALAKTAIEYRLNFGTLYRIHEQIGGMGS